MSDGEEPETDLADMTDEELRAAVLAALEYARRMEFESQVDADDGHGWCLVR